MTEDVMVVNGNRALGPFPDAAAAALYLSELGHDSAEKTVPVIAPPLVTRLLKAAYAFLQENRAGTTDEFYDAIAGTREEGVSQKRAEAVLEEARALLSVLAPDRSTLSDTALALVIYNEEMDRGGNPITAIKRLREERCLGLVKARDTMREAGVRV